MILIAYNLILPLLFLAYLPFYLIHLTRRGGLNRFFWERLGLFTAAKKVGLRNLSRPVWIHAVSVGEAVAATGFIAKWKETNPDLDFVLSTTTTTGQKMARDKLPAGVILIYCPLDFWLVVRRVLNLINPRALVIFEVEFWPCLITQSDKRGLPVILANGRMSDKSAAGYAKHSWFFRPLFERFSLFCMQSQADVNRIKKVAGKRANAYACNTMKFDQLPTPLEADRSALFERLFGAGEKLIWVAGSTHADEEELIADVFQTLRQKYAPIKLVLVPRHHERAAQVAEILNRQGISYALLDQDDDTYETPVDVLLVNKTGELMSFYGVADIVYVGKSLAGCTGGHNIIEPAIYGKPIVHGANMQNFRLVADAFRQQQASLEVADDHGLLPAMEELVGSADRREQLSLKSRQVVEQSKGAMELTLRHLCSILHDSR